MAMDGRIARAVADATSPRDAFVAATRVIAEAMSADACIIFVRRPHGTLEAQAQFGRELDATERNHATELAGKAMADTRPARDASDASAFVAVPVARVNETIGAIVAVRAASSPFTNEELMRLPGVGSEVVELIEGAEFIETIGHADLRREEEASEPPPATGEEILRGIAASAGLAIGHAAFRNTFPRNLVRRETTYRGRAVEIARSRDAFEKTRNDLVRLQAAAAAEIGEEQALIFGAHLLLLADPLFTDLVDAGVDAGRSAAVAVEGAFDEILRRLHDVRDPYVQERVEDVEDVRSRILGYLLDGERQPELGARLVISTRTTPSLVVELKARGALGIASELGGLTSHGALLARALGVPAVAGVAGLTRHVSAGDPLIIDGDAGLVVLRPTPETRAEYAKRSEAAERTRTDFLRYRDRPAATADGVRFRLQANIALGADLDVARENRADGIGLYRTEFPFIVRDALPSVEEQVRIYAKAYDAFPDGPVTFRILDLAGDKFLPGGQLGVPRDAFHGYRSIRVLFDYPHVLRDQVQAFAAAAAGRPLRVLIPLVTSVEDVTRIKTLVAAALGAAPRALTYGAMIETPAAVELGADLAREVEFFSIGTNDLIQYTLVVDREDPRLSSERHAYHPAVLRMVRRVVTTAHASRTPVTVCGEMARRPELAIALLAMGVDALSVTPRAIPELKQVLARVALEPLRARIDDVLAASSAEEIEVVLRRYVRDETAANAAPASMRLAT